MPYYHNSAEKKVVYVPESPTVYEKDSHWNVWVVVDITWAGNHLTKENRWAEPNQARFSNSYFQKNYSKEDAIGYFYSYSVPDFGEEIDKAEYDRLKAEYEEEARANKPPSKAKR